MSNVNLPERVKARLDEIRAEVSELSGVDVSYGDTLIRVFEYWPKSK